MTTIETCPKCGRQLSQERSQSPICSDCHQDAFTNGDFPQSVSPWVVIKAIIAGTLGIVPGAIFLAIGQPLPLSILIMFLGAFIGLAFALAKISARNVAGLTAGVLVAYNAPRFLQGPIIDAVAGSGDDSREKEQSAQKNGASEEQCVP
jgi:hypothetical protein